MKIRFRHFIIPAAAFLAMAACPLAAHAEDEFTGCFTSVTSETAYNWDPELTVYRTDISLWYTDPALWNNETQAVQTTYDDMTGYCEEDWGTDYDATGHCCDDWTTYDAGDYTIYFDASRAYIGDVDGNGTVQVADAVLLARYIAEDPAVQLTAEGKRNADIDANGKIEMFDLTILLRGISSSEDVPIYWVDEKGNRYWRDENGNLVVNGTTVTEGTDEEDTTPITTTTTTVMTGGGGIWELGRLWLSDAKTEYKRGEALDLSDARVYGCGVTRDGANWDMFGENTVAERVAQGWLTVDASDFDSSVPGTYTIRLHEEGTAYAADGTVTVKVFGGSDSRPETDDRFSTRETTVDYWVTTCTDDDDSTNNCCTTTYAPEAGTLWVTDDGFWKSEYRLGEELDIMNARLYGCGETADGGNWDAFGEYSLAELVEIGSLEVDISEFDSTKAGTYRIYLRQIVPREPAEGFFEVKVIAG